jgi:hypothetical protein
VAEAAARLGISETEVRRRVKAGTLPAEQFERPQGVYYRVIFDETDNPPTAKQPSTDQDAPAPAVLALVGELTAQRERADRLADRNAELEREVGRAQGELAIQNHAARATEAEAAEQRRRVERMEATLEAERGARVQVEAEATRLKARGWWDRLRNR